MAAAARSLYIYYRVTQAELARAVAAVQAMQAGLCAHHPGLRAQVLRRVEAAPAAMAAPGAEAAVTLMEVYTAAQGVDDAWVAEIEAEAARLPFETRASPRHLELFEPCG
jgi:NADH dehydrogenase/NADH:ubiquinone oxidoreductase subunit G